MANYVKIHYGPYESFHTFSHKPEKLKGVRDKLRQLGYRVDLNPVEFIDYCVFEILGYQIFRCNIRNLQLNRSSDADPVSGRAVAACLAASAKLQRARLHFWLWRLIDQAIFIKTTYRDQWPFEANLTPYASCLDCLQCCGILTKEQREKEKALTFKEIKQNLLYDLSNKMNVEGD